MTYQAFRSFFRLRLHYLVQFRGAYGLGLAAHLFTGFVRVCILWAFYRSGQDGGGMTAAQAVSYVWLTQSVWGLQHTFNASLYGKISKGDVALDLLRPLDIYTFWLSDTLATRLAPLVTQAVPTLAFAALVALTPGGLGLSAPASAAGAALCALTLLTGMLLGGAVGNLITAMVLDPAVGDVPTRIAQTALALLSGIYVPLNLFPDAFQTFLRWQPFAGMFDLPFRLYVGTLTPSDAPALLVSQLTWTIALTLLGRWWMNRDLARVTVQGG